MDDRVKAYLEYIQERKIEALEKLDTGSESYQSYSQFLDVYTELRNCELYAKRLENFRI